MAHKSISLMIVKNYRVATIFKLKPLILLKFRCSFDSCSPQIFDHAIYLYQFHENTLNGIRIMKRIQFSY